MDSRGLYGFTGFLKEKKNESLCVQPTLAKIKSVPFRKSPAGKNSYETERMREPWTDARSGRNVHSAELVGGMDVRRNGLTPRGIKYFK